MQKNRRDKKKNIVFKIIIISTRTVFYTHIFVPTIFYKLSYIYRDYGYRGLCVPWTNGGYALYPIVGEYWPHFGKFLGTGGMSSWLPTFRSISMPTV